LADTSIRFLQSLTPDAVVDFAFPRNIFPNINRLLMQLNEEKTIAESNNLAIVNDIYNAPELWEQYLANKNFYSIFSNVGLLSLCSEGRLDFSYLVNHCTNADRINKAAVNMICPRIGEIIEFLQTLIARGTALSKTACLNLITTNKTRLVDIAKPLILAHKLALEDLTSIFAREIKAGDIEGILQLSVNKQAAKLKSMAVAPAAVSHPDPADSENNSLLSNTAFP
jgi:hypothetical protein